MRTPPAIFLESRNRGYNRKSDSRNFAFDFHAPTAVFPRAAPHKPGFNPSSPVIIDLRVGGGVEDLPSDLAYERAQRCSHVFLPWPVSLRS